MENQADKKDFCGYLWRRRLQLQLSQAELAHICGISRTHYSRLERGHRPIRGVTVKTFLSLAHGLQVKPARLLQRIVSDSA